MEDRERHRRLYEWGIKIGLDVRLLAEDEFLKMLDGATKEDLDILFKGVGETDHLPQPVTYGRHSLGLAGKNAGGNEKDGRN